MSYQAVTIINGEVYEGLHQNLEMEEASPVNGLVRPSFKAEMNMRTGETKYMGVNQVNAGDLRIHGEGVLSTAVNSGMPVRGREDVKDTTLVTFNGVQMTAKSASELGLLSRSSDGRYSEGKKLEGNLSYDDPSDQVSYDEEDQGIKFNHDLFDREIEGALEAVASDLGGYAALDRHAISVMGGLVDGDITASAKRLASDAGGEPAQAESFITGVADRYRAKAVSYITKAHGVDGDAVIQWISENVPSTQRSSMAYEVYLGQTAPLDRMVQQFKTRKRS